MAQTPGSNKGPTKKPFQDVKTSSRQAGQFPGIGMTLSSYNRPISQSNLGAVKPAKQRRFPRLTPKRVFLSLLVLIVVVAGIFGGKIVADLHKAFGGNIFSYIADLFHQNKLKGEDQGRVNILLAGNSADDPNHNGGSLTDSIMVVSIDTKKNTAFMMSIPRDLWVYIPNNGHAKINSAIENTNFSQPGYPSGGMGQLEQIVQSDLGVPIDYYALIDYHAFKDAVNAVGGITITIKSPDPRGLYDPNVDKAHGGPLRLPNGPVTLDGAHALTLALARGDSPYSYGFPQGDINREQHQRQMLSALVQKASSAGVLANPIKVTDLVGSIGDNVKTDMSVNNILRLDKLIKKINLSGIQSYGLSYGGNGSNSVLRSYQAPDGEDALIPAAGIDDYSQIQAYYQQLTANN